MKLWIDDERPAPTGWQLCKTFEEGASAIFDALREQTLEAVSFDHDLGNDNPYRTGHELACILERKQHTVDCPGSPERLRVTRRIQWAADVLKSRSGLR